MLYTKAEHQITKMEDFFEETFKHTVFKNIVGIGSICGKEITCLLKSSVDYLQ